MFLSLYLRCVVVVSRVRDAAAPEESAQFNHNNFIMLSLITIIINHFKYKT